MTLASTQRLIDWLRQAALPLWTDIGPDHVGGGFVERLERDGTLVSDVRRARLVARQIYVFQTAQSHGWSVQGDRLARHGVVSLLAHHIDTDDVVIPRYLPATGCGEGGFDLYDQAFVLFGLSYAARLGDRSETEQRALRILARMRAGWQHPLGGFAEANPPVAPLKANPHMHLFEAAQAWLAISDDPAWHLLATEIAELSLARFIAAKTGALHEFFDADWRVVCDPAIDVVEPGHQAEWAWLLARWYRRTGDPRFLVVARRLFDIAEDHGCHAQDGKLINALDAGLTPQDSLMRLWPQTERIKALVVFLELAGTDAERARLRATLDRAVAGLLDYFVHPIAGSWWEHIAPGGQPVDEPARASSLYHIVGAATELSRFELARRGNAPTS